jgi:hypothetical protein
MDMDKKPLIVLSLGAGVQSSTLALMAAQGEIDMPDCAIFADVQAEPESVYEWLDWLEKQLPFPVYRISKGNLAEQALIVRTSKSGTNYQKHAPPAFILDDSTGEFGIMMRQCTGDFKIDPIRRKLRELGGKQLGVEQWLGISMDESQRMKPSRDKWIANRWPLIEKRFTRYQCLQWMQENGYPLPPRSSCWFCPYHSPTEWLRLKTEEPDSFAKAVAFEKDFQTTMSQVTGFRGNPYLNRACVPLDQIDFEEMTKTYQTDMFGNECEGLCGV